MTVLGATEPVARVPHYCTLCGRVIDPGEKYLRVRYVGDWGPGVEKRCAHCSSMMVRWLDEIAPYAYDEGYGPDDVQEWEPDTPEAAAAQAHWRERWRDAAGQLYPVPAAATEEEL